MKKYSKTLIAAVFFLLPFINLFGVNFSELNLSQDNRMLFKVDFESDHAVFISYLDTQNSLQQLTAFPEKLQLVDNGRSIIVQNRFGAARIPAAGGLPVPLPGTPSFAGGNIPLKGRLQEAVVSNDGRWALYIEPVSPAYGTLFIADLTTGVKRIVTEKIELASRDFPAKWSPDSRLFVFVKDSRLYYFPILSDLSLMIDERFRYIGPGSISSAVWGQQGDFFYFSGNTLYTIRNPELFTRTIYGDFLSIGNIYAILPFEFDSGFDRFWTAPDSGSILLSKNDRGLFIVIPEENKNPESVFTNAILPNGAENLSVLWAASGKISVVFNVDGKTGAIRFEIANSVSGAKTIKTVPAAVNPSFPNGALSPDGTKAIFWGERGLELWDFSSWQLIQRLKNETVFSCVWINNGRFISGNKRQTEEINISSVNNITQRRLCLSGADETGFETNIRGQSRVLARLGDDWYATDTRNAWVVVNEPQVRPVSLSTDKYRIFLEPVSSSSSSSSASSRNLSGSRGTGQFKNIPMMRNLAANNTVSFIPAFSGNSAYPEKQIKIALCFDLYDDNTGLYQVLAALRKNNIKATFFLNGEFIRRHPQSAAAIAAQGHETASMFYAPIDLADSRYRITEEFIIRGLARNEDEFNNATGKELSLLWHPPFYRNSALIASAAKTAGYTTAERTIDLNDWVSNEDTNRLNLRQYPASIMIEQLIESSRNGAVIPMRLGRLNGGKDEYLFQRIEVLLDALARSDIEVVPVSALSR